MRIRLDNVPERGIPVPLSLDLPWVGDALAAAFDGPATALRGALMVHKLADGFRVHGEAEAEGPATCARCGEELHLWLGGPVDLFYAPLDASGGPLAHSELALQDDEVDVGWFENGALALSDVLSEQLQLWRPAAVRCGDRPGDTDRVSGGSKDGGCVPPGQPETPDLGRQTPFARLRLPE